LKHRLSTRKRDFLEAVKRKLVPPLYTEIPYAEPVTLYSRVRSPRSFILESVKGPHKTARYSFIGIDPYLLYKAKDGVSEISAKGGVTKRSGNPVRILGSLLEDYPQRPDEKLPPFQGGAAGLLSYDFVHYLERLPATTRDDLGIPDAHFLMVDRLVAFDHLQGKAWIIVCPGAREAKGRSTLAGWSESYEEAEAAIADMTETLSSRGGSERGSAPHPSGTRIEIFHEMPRQQYVDMVRRVKDYIAAGDIFQANISLRVSAPLGGVSPWDLYVVLREINPSPFAGFLDFGDYSIVSSSPERLIMLRDGLLETRPIAGTRPRGGSASEDSRLKRELLLNEKERAEHIMLIDLERNDLGRVCEYGSVEVDEFMITEEYSHVIHIVSNIRGRSAPGKTYLDAIKATFPGGTITGVPKIRCMEIIDELEPLRRGPYTGSVGYLGFSGNMDMNIVIRTFTIKNGVAYVQAGSGIVADSDPLREYRESLKKAEALIKALENV
jgi:anthranilate/para-aminobenzoate synthase component I